jgi:hypothetical protein
MAQGIYGDSMRKLSKIIQPYVPESMQYKCIQGV